MDSLPTELLHKVCAHLSMVDALSAAAACSRLNHIFQAMEPELRVGGLRLCCPNHGLAHIKRLAAANNVDALFVQGMLQLFHTCEFDAGLESLQVARRRGHAGAAYNLLLASNLVAAQDVAEWSAGDESGDWVPARVQAGIETRDDIWRVATGLKSCRADPQGAYAAFGVSWRAVEQTALCAVRRWGQVQPGAVKRACTAGCGRWYPRRRLRPASMQEFTICSSCATQPPHTIVPFCSRLCQEVSWFAGHCDVCKAGAPPEQVA